MNPPPYFDINEYRAYRAQHGYDSADTSVPSSVVDSSLIPPTSVPVPVPVPAPAETPGLLRALEEAFPSTLVSSVRGGGGGGGGGLGLGLEAAAEAAEPQGIELGQYVGGEEGNRLIDGQWVHVTRNGGVDIIYNDFGHEDV